MSFLDFLNKKKREQLHIKEFNLRPNSIRVNPVSCGFNPYNHISESSLQIELQRFCKYLCEKHGYTSFDMDAVFCRYWPGDERPYSLAEHNKFFVTLKTRSDGMTLEQAMDRYT